MPIKSIALTTFLRIFDSACAGCDRNNEVRPFSLVLGAGASRSAGVPLAREMISALKLLADASGIVIPARPDTETEWSWVFRQVMSNLPRNRGSSDYTRDFILECVSRAEGEANITHLLAAALTQAGVFRYIVTTNFDDQALAGFWSLPRRQAYVEPHIIYDPRSSSNVTSRIASKVPIVIKAHGHHTTYGLGIVDTDVSGLAPSVKRTLQVLTAPERGYVVVGYSGTWDDGIRRTFQDRRFMRGKTIYWFVTELPKSPLAPDMDAIGRAADLTFVKIRHSDDLFLQLWNVYLNSLEDEDSRPHILESMELFTFSTDFWTWTPTGTLSSKDWWFPPSEWPNKKLPGLKRELLPELKLLEDEDESFLLYECIPDSLKNWVASQRLDVHRARLPYIRWKRLYEVLPVGVPWTRRNRKLVLHALSRACGGAIRGQILNGLSGWGYYPLPMTQDPLPRFLSKRPPRSVEH